MQHTCRSTILNFSIPVLLHQCLLFNSHTHHPGPDQHKPVRGCGETGVPPNPALLHTHYPLPGQRLHPLRLRRLRCQRPQDDGGGVQRDLSFPVHHEESQWPSVARQPTESAHVYSHQGIMCYWNLSDHIEAQIFWRFLFWFLVDFYFSFFWERIYLFALNFFLFQFSFLYNFKCILF